MKTELIVRAEVDTSGLWGPDGDSVAPGSLRLSQRVLTALDDWTTFWNDVGGEISDSEVMDEFIGQGFKIAHGIRRELKGSSVWFDHPKTGERVEIVLSGPR